jgi:hypothetical protein
MGCQATAWERGADDEAKGPGPGHWETLLKNPGAQALETTGRFCACRPLRAHFFMSLFNL